MAHAYQLTRCFRWYTAYERQTAGADKSHKEKKHKKDKKSSRRRGSSAVRDLCCSSVAACDSHQVSSIPDVDAAMRMARSPATASQV